MQRSYCKCPFVVALVRVRQLDKEGKVPGGSISSDKSKGAATHRETTFGIGDSRSDTTWNYSNFLNESQINEGDWCTGTGKHAGDCNTATLTALTKRKRR